jgi:hypothetical protein
MRAAILMPRANLQKGGVKMSHQTHGEHNHVHGNQCGHTRVKHEGHTDYLHDGHLHSLHDGHYDEHALAVNAANPDNCAKIDCDCCGRAKCSHEAVPHGNHVDHIHAGRLHYLHGDHCDDHGSVVVM